MKNYNRKKAVDRRDFKERGNQQERERVVGGKDFKVSMRALSMRENQKREQYCRTEVRANGAMPLMSL